MSFRVTATIRGRQRKRETTEIEEAKALQESFEIERCLAKEAIRPRLTSLSQAKLKRAELADVVPYISSNWPSLSRSTVFRVALIERIGCFAGITSSTLSKHATLSCSSWRPRMGLGPANAYANVEYFNGLIVLPKSCDVRPFACKSKPQSLKKLCQKNYSRINQTPSLLDSPDIARLVESIGTKSRHGPSARKGAQTSHVKLCKTRSTQFLK